MKLTFLGATKTVTGSKYLIEADNKKILVDCGLFQGLKSLRLRNWNKLPIAPSSIDAVLLTHAHLDHSGYIPLLVRDGFRGSIYCSAATYDLCSILLPDSGYIQENEAERANKYGYSKHSIAKPLYNKEDAIASLDYFKPVSFGEAHALTDELSFTLHRAGHILGSSFIKIQDNDTSILFSGDIGRLSDPVMVEPAKIQNADYIVTESTYGDRRHEDTDPIEDIGRIIRKTAKRGGHTIIPAFAVGRAQSILYYLYKLKQSGDIPDLPIFLDSPMAINTTNLLHQHSNEHRLSKEVCHDACQIATYTKTVEESKAIQFNPVPSVIISASGMATGGRILHHLKNYLGDHRNTILFTGFQAEETRGRRLVNGETEIKIHGEMYPVKADVKTLHNTSAHADCDEILTWLGHLQVPPRKVFITHGEHSAALSLQEKIKDQLNWETEIPDYLQEFEL